MHRHAHDGRAVAAPAHRERVVWIDAARALAVLGVVLFHVGFLHFQPRLADAAPGPGVLWAHVDSLLGNFRMPMLLILSGMLASGKVHRGLRGGKALESSAANYYLYVVWLVVYLLTIHDAHFPLRVWGPADLVKQLVLPYTTLWFIQCLSLGVLGLTLVHRFRPVWVLGLLLAVHLEINGFLPTDVAMPVRTLPYYLYLAVGVYFAEHVRRLAGRWLTVVVAGAGFAVAFVASQVLEGRSQPVYALVHLVACLLAALLLMGLTRLACAWRPFARFGSAVGRRTLSIYVMHLPMVAALGLLPEGYFRAVRALLAAHPVLALAYPLALMTVLAATCLGLETVLRRAGADFLFEMPEALRRHVRVEQHPAPAGATRRPARRERYVARHAR